MTARFTAPRLHAEALTVPCTVCDVGPGAVCRPVFTFSPARPTVRLQPHHVRLIDAARRT